MAAYSGLGRCKLFSSCNIFIFLFVVSSILFFTVGKGQNTTTVSTTQAATNSTNSTTTTTTTQAPVTTAAPTQPPSQIPENTDIGPCPCDLTGFACDVNCCCDDDCTADDKKVFSFCLPFSISVDDRLCMKSQLMLFDNSPFQSNYTSNDLFCIYFNNYKEKNFYVNPDLVDTEQVFNNYIKQYAEFSFQNKISQPKNLSEFYKSGDVILVVFDSRTVGNLAQPKAVSSTFCNDENPAAYLIDKKNECIRPVINLSTNCTDIRGLSASSYYKQFRVVKTPALFGVSIPEHNLTVNATSVIRIPEFGLIGPNSISLVGVFDLYDNNYTLVVQLDAVLCEDSAGLITPCSVADPVYNFTTNQCENVVKQVEYRIQYNDTFGITRIGVRFILQNVLSSVTLLPQVFSTKFEDFKEKTTPFERSGNPGYVVGQPLLVGTLNTSFDANGVLQTKILLNENRDQWFTVVRAAVDGNCLTNATQDRISVTFGQDIRSGCIVVIPQTETSQYCKMIQKIIVDALEGVSISDKRYVAIFGNSDVKKIGDWVQIFPQRRPIGTSVSEYSCSLSLGMHIQILYAKIGALANPQSKILGVSLIYDSPQTVSFDCLSSSCKPGKEKPQRVEITSSVSFVDVSKPAAGYQGDAPVFLAKLPYDFFYPFLTGTAQRHFTSSSVLMLSLVMSYICYGILTT